MTFGLDVSVLFVIFINLIFKNNLHFFLYLCVRKIVLGFPPGWKYLAESNIVL